LLLFSATSGAATLQGRIVRIIDGDSLVLLDNQNTQHEIRLAEIDAPEHKQPFGNRARQSLADLAFKREATAECPVKDKYGRSVCRVTVGEVDVNLTQVQRGMAWAYSQYVTDYRFFQAQREARAAKRGLWKEGQQVPPWDWRHRK
jgi:endonuclease YncB( thermonuclease family)